MEWYVFLYHSLHQEVVGGEAVCLCNGFTSAVRDLRLQQKYVLRNA